MTMSDKENMLRCIRFETPEFIPMGFGINSACWHHYDQEALKDLMEQHPRLFPDYQRPPGEVKPTFALNARSGHPYRDPWGCVWETTDDGITGSVHGHPLNSWDGFDSYNPPDPEQTDGMYPFSWTAMEKNVQDARARGHLVRGGLPHGHTFLRLQDIRGYENLMFDMAEDHPNLKRLIGMVEDFNYRFVQKYMTLKPDIFYYPEDLGMQVGPMISPTHFVTYIKPVYRRLMKLAIDSGCIINMHSDGDIRILASELIDAGVQIINLQDRVNGLEWIRKTFSGRTCVELDIDRQAVTCFGRPADIDALIREEVETLGSRQGGLIMIYGLYPGIPIENAKAVMDSMERYMGYYA